MFKLCTVTSGFIVETSQLSVAVAAGSSSKPKVNIGVSAERRKEVRRLGDYEMSEHDDWHRNWMAEMDRIEADHKRNIARIDFKYNVMRALIALATIAAVCWPTIRKLWE